MQANSKMREIRVVKRIPQIEVGAQIGMSQTWVSLVERCYVVPTDLEKNRIAKVLGCRPEEVFPQEAK